MALSGVETLCRAAGAASPERLPSVNARAKFDSLSAFATPAENPRKRGQRAHERGALIWISIFFSTRADRLTISPRVGLV
jgi:hypothetical protein